MAYKKKPPGERIGHARYAKSDPRYQDQGGPVTRGITRRDGIAIPEADPSWLPIARSWFNSLKLSGQCDLYEASDWMTAIAAAKALDMGLRSYNASLFAQFARLSERLGATFADRARARIVLDVPDVTDTDEDAADTVVYGWQSRLNAYRDRKRED
jgi:hypothetical protein